MTYERLVMRIREWTEGNGVILGEGASGWLHKLTEEVGELNGAYLKEKPRAEEAGEIADVLISLLVYAEGRGIDALEAAHVKMGVNEGRKGHTNKHGVFVKESDFVKTPFVIAEFGSCHEESFTRALDGIQVAAWADADAYKVQYWSSPARMRERRRVDYPLAYEHGSVQATWLPLLSDKAHEMGLEFMCTAYLPEDIEVVAPYVDRFKVSSFEATKRFINLHERWASKEVVISTGLMNANVNDANDMPRSFNLKWLHCVSAYPTPPSEATLAVIADGYDGYSDHTRCVYTGGFAVSAGADILEIHYRLRDTNPECPDYAVALTPEELAQYIMLARLAHTMRGDGVKRFQPSETVNIKHKVWE